VRLDESQTAERASTDAPPSQGTGAAKPGGSAWLRRVNLPLLGIVAAGSIFIAYWTLQVEEWGLMTDELLYVKLSLALGDLSPVPTVRGTYYGQFTPVYPLLIAPLLQVMETPAAYKAAHGLNAVLMASTAIPAYLLARDISRSQLIAYACAATAIVLPWVVYSNMLLTESAAYPVFMWTMLAMTMAVVHPSPKRDAIAVGAILLATLTRTQFALLGFVLLLAVLVHELSYRPGWVRGGSRLRNLLGELQRIGREHPVLIAAVCIGAVGLAVLAATGGVQRGAGAYGNTLSEDLLPHGISRSFRAHLAVIAANILVVPLLLAIAYGVTTLVRPPGKVEHAYAVLLGLVVVGIVLQAASVNLRTIGLVQERYAFYIAPLLVIAAAAYARRPQLPLLGLGVGAVVSLWVLAKLDFGLTNSYSFVSPFYAVMIGRAQDVGDVIGADAFTPGDLFTWIALLGSVALFFLFRVLSPGWRVAVVMVPVFAYCVAATGYDFDHLLPAQNASQARLGLGTPLERDRGLNWVDDVLPGDAEAAFAPAVIGETDVTRRAWWDLEYWNKSVTRMYDYEPAWRDTALPMQRLSLDWRTGAMQVPDRREYVVVPRLDRRFRPAGELVAGTSFLHLLKLKDPFRAEWAIRGTDGNGWTAAGKPAFVRLYSPAAGANSRVRVAIELTSSPHIPRRKSFRIDGGTRPVRGSVPSAGVVVSRLTACVRGGRPADLAIRVPGTSTLPGNLQVGLAVTAVRTQPAGTCPGNA